MTLSKSDIKAIKDSLEPHFQELENKIVEFKDEILKEITDLRDDVTVVTGQRDTIEDHESRIEKLEHHTGIATS